MVQNYLYSKISKTVSLISKELVSKYLDAKRKQSSTNW
jgi:hypothetical protein